MDRYIRPDTQLQHQKRAKHLAHTLCCAGVYGWVGGFLKLFVPSLGVV